MEIESLIEELKTTEDADRRNELALGLSEMHSDEAVPVLIELIKKLRWTDDYGQLIYALNNLNCANELTGILDIIFHGDLEACNNLLLLFKKKYPEMDAEHKAECRRIFEYEAERAQDNLETIDNIMDTVIDRIDN